ncbi:MAG: histidine kinase N-terminal 7TM domain-containing protein [Anaerolineae bacterium]|nr:PAS domain S-box protein [Thermoflexales bacterium]MDW8408919.1 histidine kinase N-terminal 7TM domain-containing protein [Anaerolineae bacterium]
MLLSEVGVSMEDWYRVTYELSLGLSISTVIAIAIYVWRQRTVAGRRPFAILLLLTSLLLLARFIEMVEPTLEGKRPWANIQYGLLAILPVALFVFVMLYTGHNRWVRRPILILLSVIPGATWGLLLTNRYHNLVWESTYLREGWAKLWLERTHGPWAPIQDTYSIILLTVSIGVLLAELLRAQRYYIGQIAVLLFAVLLPAVSETIINPRLQLDLLPFTVMISAALMVIGLLRFRLLNLVPLARAVVIENMSTAMVVVDELERIVDANPAALRMLGISNPVLIGQKVDQLLAEWPELRSFCRLSDRPRSGVLSRPVSSSAPNTYTGEARWYEVHSTPLLNRRGMVNGALVLLSDITDLKRAEEQRIRERRAMAILEERERLARELHDSVGQSLSYVKLQSLAARDALARGDVLAAEALLTRLIDAAQDMQTIVRHNIRSLFVRPMDYANFLAALRDQVDRFCREGAVQVRLSLPDALDKVELPPDTGAQLLRIVQEALVNVQRHAAATCVCVALSVRDDGWLEVVVEDDGYGFDPDDVKKSSDQHFGLEIMKARAQDIGADLRISSQRGCGTRVSIVLPSRVQSAVAAP